MCVCVCACVRVRARVGACARSCQSRSMRVLVCPCVRACVRERVQERARGRVHAQVRVALDTEYGHAHACFKFREDERNSPKSPKGPAGSPAPVDFTEAREHQTTGLATRPAARARPSRPRHTLPQTGRSRSACHQDLPAPIATRVPVLVSAASSCGPGVAQHDTPHRLPIDR